MTSPVLILGGSGGIGSAVAQALVARGTPVHLAARDGARLAPLARSLKAPYTAMDATDQDDVERTLAEAGDTLSGLVYAVGSIVIKPFEKARAEDFLEAYRLNLVGAAMALQAAAPALGRGKGAAVLFSTVAAAQGFANHTVIAAAKGAVEAFTRAAATDLAPAIRVNCIAPSLTRTPLAEAFTANQTMARGLGKLHALERLGEAEDVAGLAAFLVGPDADWITGQVIGVDGGRSTLRTKG
ncbi:MAG: SDR family oxidoreductase [Inquilinus sp.]|nr:SDR family oxidoreductase [Inquilinus sp.]